MVMILLGAAASQGVRSGIARIVRGPDDQARVQAGEIGVSIEARNLTPLLGHAAALLCESGGPLCSLAPVAREFGTPLVVALPRASSVIADGDFVTIDGAAGLVLVHGRSSGVQLLAGALSA